MTGARALVSAVVLSIAVATGGCGTILVVSGGGRPYKRYDPFGGFRFDVHVVAHPGSPIALIFAPETGRAAGGLIGPPGLGRRIAISPGGTLLAAYENEWVRFLDLGTGREMGRLPDARSYDFMFSFAAEEGRLSLLVPGHDYAF